MDRFMGGWIEGRAFESVLSRSWMLSRAAALRDSRLSTLQQLVMAPPKHLHGWRMTPVSEEVISPPQAKVTRCRCADISRRFNICSLSAVTFIWAGLLSSISSARNTRNYWCICPFILPRYALPPRGAAEHPVRAQRAKHPTQVMKRNRAEEMNVTGKRQSPCRERGGGSSEGDSKTVNVSDRGGGSGWVQPPPPSRAALGGRRNKLWWGRFSSSLSNCRSEVALRGMMPL